ncbi:DUF4344 domain-containing metallopeptidase [uncultured Photobacterium sp.]|uniref:DUF4344 domain-containing metallopeptidase n=1 Tax=uncultured Photobacterium sp. TaxID=173973 RepID=UPI00262AF339|nr:DUF4344 domain-containing metallopeptidase [uncultured Photobacterium sp.]
MLKKHFLPLGIVTTLSLFGFRSFAESSSAIQVSTKPTVEYQYLPAKNAVDKQVLDTIQSSDAVNIVQDLSQSVVVFSKPVTVVFGALDGPLYDPEQHQIQIPYSFFNHAIERFKSNNYKKSGISEEQAALDTLLHTLLHELGHAFVADNNIPVLGKEEDAVDNFATVLLLNYIESGDEVAISAADLFAYEDQQIEAFDSLDFIDEHSLDIQRYYYTLCLIYGSNPEQHSQLLEDIEKDFKTEREDVCEEEFERVSHNWMTYLNSENI